MTDEEWLAAVAADEGEEEYDHSRAKEDTRNSWSEEDDLR